MRFIQFSKVLDNVEDVPTVCVFDSDDADEGSGDEPETQAAEYFGQVSSYDEENTNYIVFYAENIDKLVQLIEKAKTIENEFGSIEVR